MRPCILRMKAFGSYAAETTIDFNNFNSGLYIITGDTGAGKTTIFDAIVFALYGKASGKDRDPKKVFHSDFVSKKIPTEVELEFLHGDKKYVVKRNIKFSAKRGTKDEYGEGKITAELVECCGGTSNKVCENDSVVTKRITEILGLDKDQFSKIVMLAQGEFKEFLKADSNKKNEILGKLFDNSRYVRFQSIIDGTRNALAAQRKEADTVEKNILNNVFIIPEELSEEEHYKYMYGNSHLIEDITALIEEENKVFDKLSVEKVALNTKKDKTIADKSKAESNNALLKELDNKNLHLVELTNKYQEYVELTNTFNKAQKAVFYVMPCSDNYKTKDSEVLDVKFGIKVNQTQLNKLKVNLEAATKEYSDNTSRNEKVIEISNEIAKLEDIILKLKELEELSKQQVVLEAECARENKVYEDILNTIAQAKEQYTKVKTAIEELKDAEVATVNAQKDYNEKKSISDRFEGDNGFIRERDAILSKLDNLKKLQDKIVEAVNKAKESSEAYNDLHNRFIEGQASSLAKELSDRIEKEGQAYCPVCKNLVTDGRHLVEHKDKTAVVTREAVELADAKRKKADDNYHKLESEYSAAQSTINEQKKNLVNVVAQTLAVDFTEAEIFGAGFLENKSKEYLESTNKALDIYEYNKKRCLEYKKHKENAETLEQHLEKLEKDKTNQEVKKNAAKDAWVKTEAAYKEKASVATGYADKQAAESKLNELVASKANCEKEIKAATEQYNKIAEEHSKIAGQLEEQIKRLPVVEAEKQKTELELAEALKNNGFESEEELLAATLVDGIILTKDSQWFDITRNKINDYNNDVKNTNERVEELIKSTQGMAYTELTAYDEEIKAIGELINGYEVRITELNTYISNHTQCLKKIIDAKKSIASTERAFNCINKLADVAVGVNSDSGKIDFERYISGAVFREIIAMANIRLEDMSGGQIELKHKVVGNRTNEKAGLDIEVYDNYTGTTRDCSSLSGGESFMASMALALGLSDVVKNRAGGIRIESMFIDEGFGSLDDDKLDKSINVLRGLTEGNCLVGIISHISVLERAIDDKISVKYDANKGSSIA